MSQLEVRDFMTPAPHTIGASQTLATAQEVMRGARTRHLPVLEAGKLVGLLSQRDVAMIASLPGVVLTEVAVEDAMSQPVYRVAPGAALHAVAATMAKRRLGSAVVCEGERVVGIFTTVDAMEALAAVTMPRRRARG
jgi:acetoin utilization protein AcuB